MTENRVLGNGRYVLGGVLGRGGMAEVRQARDLRLQRDVAVKELRIDLAGDPTFQARFRREAHAAASLSHPNIVTVYDTGEEQDSDSTVRVPYIVMELVNGKTLREIIRDGRKILPTRALQFTEGVLDALSYSHKAGIVHRDIKPANVMITNSGQVKVMDFGIARAVADTSATMTQTAAVIGTAQYLSPEQARGETVDARSDIYSTGCLLYELLTGRPPFQGDSPVSVAYQHVRENPVPPSHIDPLVTPAMDAICLKALAKDPAHRYQTASGMRADIARLLAGQEVNAKLPPVAAVPTNSNAQTQVLAAQAGATGLTQVLTDDTSTGRLPTRAIVPEEQKSRKGLYWTLGIAALLLAVLAGTYFVLNQQPTTVAVPNVVNFMQAEAEQSLKNAKLVPSVVSVAGPDDTTVGRVTKQDPVPTNQVALNSTVTITVNVGPKKLQIPTNLVGKQLADVENLLRAAGFNNFDPQAAPTEDSTAKADQVTSLSPTEGATVTADTKITIYVATGSAKVPNLNSLVCTDAVTAANNAGFLKTSVVQKASSTAPVDSVIGQNPAPNTVAKKTDTVTITCAIAAPTVPATTTPTPTITTPSASPSPSVSKTP